MRKFLRFCIALIAVGLLGYCGYQFYGYYSEAKESSQVTDALADEAVVYLTSDSGDAAAAETTEAAATAEGGEATLNEQDTAAEFAPISVDFDVLHQSCGDIVAWIYCEDTPINYPIVQASDNDYYLHRLTDGTYNSSGTLFMDCRNSADFSDLNTIVYGHNMKNDSMFGTLPNYEEQSYYDAHPVIWLLTPSGDYKLELIAGYLTANNDEIYSGVQTYEELKSLVDEVVAQSTFTSGVTLEEDDRIVSLSTCSYEYDNARYVLLGRVVEVS